MADSCCSRFTVFLFRLVLFPLFATLLLVFLAPFYRLRDGWILLWRQQRHVTTPAEHRKKVAAIQEQVRAWVAAGRLRPMCTARKATNSMSVLNRDKRNLAQINLSALNCLVEVDEANAVLTVEPGMLMGQLTTLLAARGWTWSIPVIPEFEYLSIGGTVCGAGIESGSRHYGLMADSAVGFEVVLSSGEVVQCSRTEHPDLFYSIKWSHGTTAFLTAATFPLIRAGPHVQVQYTPTDSFEEAQRLLEADARDATFVEGLAFAPDRFVVMHGKFVENVDSKVGRVNHINRWYKPFFYNHVKGFLSRLSKGPAVIEFIPTRDYFHRHSRAQFWVAHALSPVFPTRLYLALFGWVLPLLDIGGLKRIMSPVLRVGGAYRGMQSVLNVVQDYIIPMKHLRDCLGAIHKEVGASPLWLCPTKMTDEPGMSHTRTRSVDGGRGAGVGDSEELYMNIGVYGRASDEARATTFHPEHTLRKLEELVVEKNGYTWTYADMFLTYDQWCQMFDMTFYDSVRAKYDALDAFPHVYDKLIRNAIRPA